MTGEEAVYEKAWEHMGISAFSSPFCCLPKIALKLQMSENTWILLPCRGEANAPILNQGLSVSINCSQPRVS